MQLAKRLLHSATIRNIHLVLQIIVAFVMMPFIIHSLGDRMYGFWVLIGTFMGYYGLLDLGLSSATSRFVSQSLGRQDENGMNEIFNNSLLLFTFIGLFICLLSFLVYLLSSFFIENPVELHVFKTLLILLGINIAISFPVKAFEGVLTSFLRFDLIAYAAIIRLLISNLLIYFFLSAGYGIVTIGVITFATSLLQYFLVIVFTRKVFTAININFSLQNRSKFRKLFNYSWKSFAIQFGGLLKNKVDVFVIAGFLNVNLVTYYSVATRIIEYLTTFMINTMGILLPVFSQYEGRNHYDTLREKFFQMSKLSATMSVFMGLSVFFYGKSFIVAWMGDDFTVSYTVLIILCTAFTTSFMQNPSLNLLYGISKHHLYAIANNLEGIFNLLLSLVLVKFYGLYGVALGTAIPMIIFKLFIQPIYVCRAIEISARKYYWNTMFLPAFKTAVPLMIYFYYTRSFITPDFTNILLLFSLQTLLFLPYAFFVILDGDLQATIKKSLSPIISKLAWNGITKE